MTHKHVFSQIDIEDIGAPIAVAGVQPDGRFTGVAINQLARAYYNMRPEWWIGRDLQDYQGLTELAVYTLKRAVTNYKQCVQTRSQISNESKQEFEDGSVKWARHSFTPMIVNSEVRHIIITSIETTELKEAQQQLNNALTKVLSGFITICATCKSIKDDEQQWQPIEKYAASHMDYHQFSHGICPTCYEKHEEDLTSWK